MWPATGRTVLFSPPWAGLPAGGLAAGFLQLPFFEIYFAIMVSRGLQSLHKLFIPTDASFVALFFAAVVVMV